MQKQLKSLLQKKTTWLQKEKKKRKMSQGQFSGVHAEAKTKEANLTASDRKLLRAYLGFQPVKQLSDMPTKKRTEACLFIDSTLWGRRVEKNIKPGGDGRREDGAGEEEDEEEEKEEEDNGEEEFDLDELVRNTIPRIFDSSTSDLKQMFKEARSFDDERQIAAVRTFMVSSFYSLVCHIIIRVGHHASRRHHIYHHMSMSSFFLSATRASSKKKEQSYLVN